MDQAVELEQGKTSRVRWVCTPELVCPVIHSPLFCCECLKRCSASQTRLYFPDGRVTVGLCRMWVTKVRKTRCATRAGFRLFDPRPPRSSTVRLPPPGLPAIRYTPPPPLFAGPQSSPLVVAEPVTSVPLRQGSHEASYGRDRCYNLRGPARKNVNHCSFDRPLQVLIVKMPLYPAPPTHSQRSEIKSGSPPITMPSSSSFSVCELGCSVEDIISLGPSHRFVFQGIGGPMSCQTRAAT